MAKKDMQTKIADAKKKLEGVQAATGEGADKKVKAKLRDAKKKVKRAQRRLKLKNAIGAKRDAQEANRQKNIQTAGEKAAKKKADGDGALVAAAEKQAE
ncbi:MAG: hypothetical protein OEZ04_04265 [Nitrospinota bacterium]|nr:hypothetical protein [Nitrospinota bacterium]